MTTSLPPDEARLDSLWRARFGQPMPMVGAPDIVRRILRQNGVSPQALKPVDKTGD